MGAQPVLDGIELLLKEQVCSLEVFLTLVLDGQVAAARSKFAQLGLVCQLWSFRENTELTTVSLALVISQWDHCSVVCVGLLLKSIQKLPVVQNAAARLLMGTMQGAPSTPILWELHWLPIGCHSQIKVLVITFKFLYGFEL